MSYKEMVDEIVWPNPHAAKLFLDEVEILRKHNLTEECIATRFEVTTMKFRALRATAGKKWWTYLKEKVLKMNDEGYSRAKIAMDLGLSESTIHRFFETQKGSDQPEDGG